MVSFTGSQLKKQPLKSLDAKVGAGKTVFPTNLAETGQFVAFRVFKRDKGSIEGGVRGKPYLATILNTIYLPMPANLSTGYTADYQNEDLGIVGAGILGSAQGALNTAEKAVGAIAGGIKSGTLGGLAKGAGEAVGAITDSIAKAVNSIDASSAAAAATALVASQAGGPLKAAVADVKGVAANPHRVVLFQGVQFREHQFSYRLSPRNQQESDAIRDIIYKMKYYMLPSFGGAGGGFASRAFLNYPELFEIQFRNRQHLFEIAASVLKSFTVNYHPMGYPGYIRNGDTVAPVEVEINMTFQETEIITKEFIEDERVLQGGGDPTVVED